MILIFGFRNRLKALVALTFFCPSCGADRAGHRMAVRRWFTLFWIPVIPLNVIGEVVRCDQCQGTFSLAALHRPTNVDLQDHLRNATRALTVMLVAEGDRTDPVLRARAVAVAGRVVPGYTDDTLATDLDAIDPALAADYVVPLQDGLVDAGAEGFLADLVRVAADAGALTAGQRRVVDAAGHALGLTPVHVTGVVATVLAEQAPRTDLG